MDLDGDGRLDILSGSYSPGELYLFRRQPDGQFASGVVIKDKKGKAINVGLASSVFAADWRGTGRLDLIIGNISGEVYLVPNEGTAKEYAFGKPEKLKANGKPIVVAGDAGPTVADWDGDGKLDLLVGAGDGSITWYRNEGKDNEPVLAAGKTLLGAADQQAKASCGQRTKLCVVDFNDDGRLDLLVGDFHFEQEKMPEPKPEEKPKIEAAKKEYQKAMDAYVEAYRKSKMPELFRQQQELSRAPDEETPEAARERTAKLQRIQKELQAEQKELQPLLNKLMEARKKVPQPKYYYHGYVWLFERRAAEKSARVPK